MNDDDLPQVYYMCQGRGGGRPFLCPEGTKFNQRTFVCDHAARVKCSEAGNFFHRNLILQQESNGPRQNGEAPFALVILW